MEKILDHLKGKFATGLFIVIPIGITIFILKFLFNFADGSVGHRVPRAEPASQSAISCRAVGVRGVLRQDRLDQHVHLREAGLLQHHGEPQRRPPRRQRHRAPRHRAAATMAGWVGV